MPADLAIAGEQQPFLGFSVDSPFCPELCLAPCCYTTNSQCCFRHSYNAAGQMTGVLQRPLLTRVLTNDLHLMINCMNEPSVGNVGQGMAKHLLALSSDVHVLTNMCCPSSNTSCHEQAGPSGEEEEDSEEEQAEGEEREERKRYQLRERRPIQPNLYQPSFGGQPSRQALFHGRHHLAELLVVSCLAVITLIITALSSS